MSIPDSPDDFTPCDECGPLDERTTNLSGEIFIWIASVLLYIAVVAIWAEFI